MIAKRVLPALLLLFVAIYVVTAIASGSASFVLAVVLVVLYLLAGVGLGVAAQRAVTKRHVSREHAMSDHEEPIPAAPFIPDDETALGDTTEAHDEITPHDLPVGHPGRARAEELAGHTAGTTRGDLGA